MMKIHSFYDHPKQRDFIPLPPDKTIVKVTITRRCWTKTREGGEMAVAEAGSVLQVERHIADLLRANGKADLL